MRLAGGRAARRIPREGRRPATVDQIAVVAFVEGSLFILFTTAERSALPGVVATEQRPTAMAENEARTRDATRPHSATKVRPTRGRDESGSTLGASARRAPPK